MIMVSIDDYIREVKRGIVATPERKRKLEEDLRVHFNELRSEGIGPGEALARMGTPEEVAAQFMEETPKKYGGFFHRLAAFLVDAGLIAAAIMPVGLSAMLTMVWSANRLEQLSRLGDNISATEPVFLILTILAMLTSGLLLVSIMVAGLIYFPFFERIRGATPGKMLLGLHVLTEEGCAIGWKEALIRRIPFYFEIMVLDAIFVPFNARKQRAFDMVAKTIVLKEGRHERSGLNILLALLLMVLPFLFVGLLFILLQTNLVSFNWV
ncbi:hypothetical protein GF324_11655 [bacterium]|nr:hypothetical protein [bacterium]